MHATNRDGIKRTFTPTLFGLFESQKSGLLKKVRAYVYDKEIKRGPVLTTCHGVMSGGRSKVTLNSISNEFAVYSAEVQAEVLTRVNKYVDDLTTALFNKPTHEQMDRLLAVQSCFKSKLKNQEAELCNTTVSP